MIRIIFFMYVQISRGIPRWVLLSSCGWIFGLLEGIYTVQWAIWHIIRGRLC